MRWPRAHRNTRLAGPVPEDAEATELPRSEIQETFRSQGFVVERGLLNPHQVEVLRAEIERTPERDPGPNPLTLDTMRFASNLFYASERLQELLGTGRVIDLVRQLLGPEVWVRWDQAVWKGPGAPLFPWHQDNGYTELDAEHLQVWVALTPMNSTNGGLSVIPNGARQRFDHRWVGNHVECFTAEEANSLGAISVSAEPGDVVLFSSWLPHATTRNSTDTTRLAYVAEYLPCSVDDPSVPEPRFVPRPSRRTTLDSHALDSHDIDSLWGEPT